MDGDKPHFLLSSNEIALNLDINIMSGAIFHYEIEKGRFGIKIGKKVSNR
jgi:hypothetical protein